MALQCANLIKKKDLAKTNKLLFLSWIFWSSVHVFGDHNNLSQRGCCQGGTGQINMHNDNLSFEVTGYVAHSIKKQNNIINM